MSKNKFAPIGVFDSGVGGLTVVREIMALMPGQDIIYLGDTARVPYGVRSPETVKRYAREGADFLLKKDIGMLVVACNTVSAIGLEDIAKTAGLPVLGVILPGARTAAGATVNGKIGVIGTSATVGSGAYTNAIKAISAEVEVSSTPCPLFVPLVEEGWLSGEVPEKVALRYLESMRTSAIDTLVLGCTHYPLLAPMLSNVMGSGIKLIDSAHETAQEVCHMIKETGGISEKKSGGRLEIYVTDSPDKFAQVGGAFLGSPMEHIEKVELEAHK